MTSLNHIASHPTVIPLVAVPRQPKLGFLGTGWIGRLRMHALFEAECVQFGAVHDPSPEAAAAAAAIAPHTVISETLEDLLAEDLDGLVIATPGAMQAQHCRQALARGKSVFCQKPLARTAQETASVVAAARTADRLLGVDFSYRHLSGMQTLRDMVQAGELGEVFAVDLTFHNAYGPDKPWFYDLRSSGGGCVMDLGIHLMDLALWLVEGEINNLNSRLFRQGQPLVPPYDMVEDYAVADFTINDAQVRLCCSWNTHAGQDAIIEAHFHGTKGGASVRNVDGSFFDFEVHHCRGTARERLAGYPDDWGERALTAWAKQLARSPSFDPDIEDLVQVAQLIDRIYQR